MTNEPVLSKRGEVARWGSGIASADPHLALICALVLAAIVNGLATRVAVSIQREGFLGGLAITFDVSAVVWCAILVFWNLIWRGSVGQIKRTTKIMVAGALLLVLSPLSSMSWLALSLLSIYYLTKPDVDDLARRAFWVALALCLSQQWAKWASTIFMPTILHVDAILVSALSGFPRYGNLVQAGDGSQTLVILEACSSFVNVSLAYLAWLTARSYFGTQGFWRGIFFSTMSAATVVFVNTARIALIAFRPDLYDLIHGSVGAFFANIISTASIVTFSIYGARK